MTILFLHGWHSVIGGVKPMFLRDAGHEVLNPALDDDDFDAAVHTAQAEFDLYQPDVIVGSSREGELRAEIAAAFMCSEIGIPQSDDLSNTEAYLASWLKSLESDHRFIFKASAAASKAADYVLSFSREAEPVAA